MIAIKTNIKKRPERCFDCGYLEQVRYSDEFVCLALMRYTKDDFAIPNDFINNNSRIPNCPLIDTTSIERAITCVETSFIAGLQAMAELKNNINQEKK